MRRDLGFKLREAGKGLLEFVDLHGAAPRGLHHLGVGSCMGATTDQTTGRPIGRNA